MEFYPFSMKIFSRKILFFFFFLNLLSVVGCFLNRFSFVASDFGVISGAVIYIKEDLKITDVEVEILVGILNLYCLIGSFAAGRTSDWIGRRYCILVTQVIFFVGAILMGFATNYAFLMVGRFVVGVAVGYGLMVAPVYTAEISPTSSRGFLTSFTEVGSYSTMFISKDTLLL